MSLPRASALLWAGMGLVAASGGFLAASAETFSPPRLASLALHVVLGAVLLPPVAAWWWRRRRRPGLAIGGLLVLGGGVAGLALAVAGNRRALAPLLAAHVVLATAGLLALLAALARQRGALARIAAAVVAVALVAAAWLGPLRPRQPRAAAPFTNPPAPLSAAGEAMGGAAGPFYPSALATRTGSPLPARFFTGAEGCGRAGCHPAAVAEWSASAHRFSGLDNPWYRRTYEEMRRTAGPVPSRWCAGCHTPALLATGALARPAAELAGTAAAAAGVSCAVCHAARVKSSMGQAALELDPRRLDGLPDGAPGWRGALATLAVRLDPAPHRRAMSSRALTPELCSACHKAEVDLPIGGHPFLSVMDDYDPWQTTSASGQGMTQSIYFPPARSCAGCHMPRTAAGLHSHRFAAANTALPALRGDRAQLRAVTGFLQAGQLTLDIFAMTRGRPSVASTAPDAAMGMGMGEEVLAPIDRLPAALRRGESTRFDVVVRSRGVGHMFPGGKGVPADCWLEVKAADERGRTVFWSGRLAADSTLEPGAHRFGGAWLDAGGSPVERYEIWRYRLAAYLQRIEPYTAAVARFRVDVPADAGDRLVLTARLRYRRFPPAFTRWVFGGQDAPGLPAPIVTLAERSLALPVLARGAPRPEMGAPRRPDADLERWNDYAFALANSASYGESRRVFQALLARHPGYADGWTTLGNLEWAVGDMAAARAALARALALAPGLARAHFYQGEVEQKEGRYDRALAHLGRAAAAYPRDPLVWLELGRTRFLAADYPGAAAALGRAIEINPQEPTAHFVLALTNRALGRAPAAGRELALFNRYREDLSMDALRSAYLLHDPDAGREASGFHEHTSQPLAGAAGVPPSDARPRP